jgi:hypothetical protein
MLADLVDRADRSQEQSSTLRVCILGSLCRVQADSPRCIVSVTAGVRAPGDIEFDMPTWIGRLLVSIARQVGDHPLSIGWSSTDGHLVARLGPATLSWPGGCREIRSFDQRLGSLPHVSVGDQVVWTRVQMARRDLCGMLDVCAGTPQEIPVMVDCHLSGDVLRMTSEPKLVARRTEGRMRALVLAGHGTATFAVWGPRLRRVLDMLRTDDVVLSVHRDPAVPLLVHDPGGMARALVVRDEEGSVGFT